MGIELCVEPVADDRELESLAGQWNSLARGVPFRCREWLHTWWRHYGHRAAEPRASAELFVLAVRDPSGNLVGVAPWYVDHCAARGRVLRFLGSGEVCSDYQSLLATPEFEAQVARSVAEYLCGAAYGKWDALELSGVDAEDPTVRRLEDELRRGDCLVEREPGLNCWRLDLPDTWDEYVAGLSKGHRKQVRRLESRVLDTDRARLHSVRTAADLQRGWDVLVDLHQRRRATLSQPGCFSSPRFAAFHRDALDRLLSAGMLRLDWLELDGRPVTAEYHVAGGGIVYAYQAGVEPDALEDEPGRLITIALLRTAIADGYSAIDFLRGDEPYKAHFRAEPRPSVVVRAVPARFVSRVRHRAWQAGNEMKALIKKRLRTARGKSTPVAPAASLTTPHNAKRRPPDAADIP